MARFIICFGEMADYAVVDAPTLRDAETEARNRALATGCDLDWLDDCFWAKPYEAQLAREVGAEVPEERERPRASYYHRDAVAPWRD